MNPCYKHIYYQSHELFYFNKAVETFVSLRKFFKTMNSIISLPVDCTYEIIKQLPEETTILYKFLFVNRFWCKCIVPILWKNPFKKINEDEVKHALLIP